MRNLLRAFNEKISKMIFDIIRKNSNNSKWFYSCETQQKKVKNENAKNNK